MKKRLLSMLMALVLCLTLLPTAALADELGPVDGTSTVETAGADAEAEAKAKAGAEAVAAVQAMIDALPDALTLISIGPRSTFRMKSSFSCRSFPSTRDRMSSAAVAAVPVTASRSSRFSIFCFFTSAGISRSIFCLLYGV